MTAKLFYLFKPITFNEITEMTNEEKIEMVLDRTIELLEGYAHQVTDDELTELIRYPTFMKSP